MTTLSTEDNTRPGADDHDPDGFNPVLEVMEKSWQRLFAQSAWKPQQLPRQARPVGGGTTAGCPVREGAGNFFETWVI